MKKEKIKVLSLFDGVSCARVALDKLNIDVHVYFASEIDKYAIQISQNNWPLIRQIGDVKNVGSIQGVGVIDLLIGGSPCQDLSIAKNNRKGLDGERSGLFWEYVRILKEVRPRYFILENVNSMPKEAKDLISETLGVEPIMINAALVSAKNRKRLFWVGKLVGEKYEQVSIIQPEDRNIYLKDIILDGETEDLKSLCITASYHKKNLQNFKKRDGQMIRIGDIGSNAQAHRVYSVEGKSVALSALGGGQGAKTGLYIVQRPRGYNKGGEKALDGKTPTLSVSKWEHNNHLYDNGVLRKLHPIECERLQGLPDDYTSGVSNTQRYKACGNAFNVDVVAHIIKQLDL